MRRRILLSLCVPGAVFAQASQGHVDYAKADLIRTAGAFVLNSAVAPTWFQDSTRFYYRSASPSGISTVYVVDPAKRARTQMFDNVRLASAMSLAGDTMIDASRLPNFRLTDDEKGLRFTIGKRRFDCALGSYACVVMDTTKIEKPETPNWAVLSPDKKWEAFSHNYNIYVRPAGMREPPRPTDSTAGRGGRGGRGAARVDSLTLPVGAIQLTTDGIDEYAYGTATPSTLPTPRPTRQRPQLIWSPDSK